MHSHPHGDALLAALSGLRVQEPYTLNPTPYTLNPAPYTLNPKPYTPNPRP